MTAGAYAPMTASAYAPEEPAPVAAPPVRPASTGSAYADQRLQEAIREIDQRLASMHLIPPRTEPPRAAAPGGPVTANAIEAAVAEIAARQNELDSAPRRRTAEAPAREPVAREPMARDAFPREPMGREHPPREPYSHESLARENAAREPRPAPARRESAPRDAISERFVRDPFAAGGFPPRAASTPTPTLAPTPSAAPAAAAISPAAVQTAVGDVLSVLQGELGGMRQSLATLAPRRAVDELQRVVQQLADRVERSGSRDEDLRSTLVALRDMIGGLKLPEHPALLLGRIDALERKLDIVNAKVVDGATVARLQAQAGEIRELLARTLSSDSVRLLAEQVSMLAAKVSDMAANEDRAFRTAVGSLERRLDTLADKIGNQPAPVIPLDDLVGRLDAIQTSLASARRELPAGMETLINGLSERIERIERPISIPDNGPRLDDLSRQIGELTQRIEKAVAGAEIASQLSSIERGVNDLFIQMEETRATFLAGSHPRPPGNGGTPNGGARIRREIAAVEARAPTASAPTASAQTSPVAAAPVAAMPAVSAAAAMPAVSAAPAPAAEAVATSPAEPAPVVEATFTPAPASIPKPFEPQLMRAALEELNRSAGAAAALGAGPVAAGAPASVPSAAFEATETDTADIETADAPPPAELETLDERVRSRLAGGLVVEMGPLDDALRMRILEARIAAMQVKHPAFQVGPEVVTYVASVITTNGRDLDGAVNRLLAHTTLSGGEITVETAENAIRDLVRTREPKRVKIEDIQKLVATRYNVSRADILSERRTAAVVKPRQIAMYLSKQLTLRSLPEIGRRFGGRDHTTVLHAVRKIEKQVGEDRSLSEEVELLKRMLLD